MRGGNIYIYVRQLDTRNSRRIIGASIYYYYVYIMYRAIAIFCGCCCYCAHKTILNVTQIDCIYHILYYPTHNTPSIILW